MAPTKHRILCINISQDTSDLIQILLGDRRYETQSATDLNEAICKAASEHFGLYVIEPDLMDRSGLALCKLLRAYNPNSPVIIFSPDRRVPSTSEALAAGAAARIHNDGDVEVLVETVKRLLPEDPLVWISDQKATDRNM
jgi:DNA-binding NtrC family response regulator